MIKNKAPSPVYVLAASVCSVFIAYLFGNNGYEAMVTTAIALGLLVTWQCINLVRMLFGTKTWLIIKLIGLLPLGFFWFIAIAGVMLSISRNAFDPNIEVPTINWLVVIAGITPFLLPRVGLYKLASGFQKTAVGLLVSLYSISVSCIAIIGFYNNQTSYHDIILVIAVQLQYLLNYFVTRTDYMNRSHSIAVNVTKRLRISNHDINNYLVIFVVGLPFILPLIAIMLISVV